MPSLRSSVLVFILSYALPITAGPGAEVYACINLGIRPSTNFTVTFNPISGGNKCMNSVGNAVTIDIYQSGLSCGEIGYVEGKASSSGGDLCATDESIWNLAYNTNKIPNAKSGSVRSRWRKLWGSETNEISFKAYTTGAQVCGSEALCSATDFYWSTDTKGPAYFIFQPDKQTTSLVQGDDQLVMEMEL
ncbi:hypothetical protein HD806DRAFT_469088 [Xylariaceae sp. AK1471]|nr:hypothetical protein HD806DRAFT_469088 [Xylariaceae sp. AK1471]